MVLHSSPDSPERVIEHASSISSLTVKYFAIASEGAQQFAALLRWPAQHAPMWAPPCQPLLSDHSSKRQCWYSPPEAPESRERPARLVISLFQAHWLLPC